MVYCRDAGCMRARNAGRGCDLEGHGRDGGVKAKPPTRCPTGSLDTAVPPVTCDFYASQAPVACNAGCKAIAPLRDAARCQDGDFSAYLRALFPIAHHAPSLTQLAHTSAPAPHPRCAPTSISIIPRYGQCATESVAG